MPTDIVMPQMGESIFEGTITKWLKKPGDKVQRDEPLFEISTDKVDAEIPAPASGILQDIKVAEGATVQVNTVVGTIAADGEAAAPAKSAPAAASRTAQQKRSQLQPTLRRRPLHRQPAPVDKNTKRKITLVLRRWSARSPASTMSTLRKCPVPASVDALPSRTSRRFWREPRRVGSPAVSSTSAPPANPKPRSLRPRLPFLATWCR